MWLFLTGVARFIPVVQQQMVLFSRQMAGGWASGEPFLGCDTDTMTAIPSGKQPRCHLTKVRQN